MGKVVAAARAQQKLQITTLATWTTWPRRMHYSNVRCARSSTPANVPSASRWICATDSAYRRWDDTVPERAKCGEERRLPRSAACGEPVACARDTRGGSALGIPRLPPRRSGDASSERSSSPSAEGETPASMVHSAPTLDQLRGAREPGEADGVSQSVAGLNLESAGGERGARPAGAAGRS